MSIKPNIISINTSYIHLYTYTIIDNSVQKTCSQVHLLFALSFKAISYVTLMSPFLPLSICLVIILLFPTWSLPPLFHHCHLQNFFCHKYRFLPVTSSHHLGFFFLVSFWVQLPVLVYFVTSIPDAMQR